MNPTKATFQPKGAKQKSPSYLSRIKDELLNLIVAQHATDEQTAQEIRKAEWVGEIWKYVQTHLAQSYWNGVSAGASGRVKPKQGRTRRGEGE